MKQVFQSLEQHLTEALEYYREDLGSLRTGRAHPSLIEDLPVEAYESKMTLKSIATISTPDPRTFVIQPWDRVNIDAICKAVESSNLSLKPINEGNLIRVTLPELTSQQRQDMVKILGQKTEEARIKIRLARRDSKEELEKLESEGNLSEDELKRGEEEIQRLHDETLKKVDTLRQDKEDRLLQI